MIGCVSTLLPVKNITFLLDIFYQIKKDKKNNYKLLLIGDGYLLDELKEKTKRLGMEDQVIFGGIRKDVHHVYSAMDCYIMTSISEGFGLSLCEAQVNGLKCFASDAFPLSSNISNSCTYISLSLTAKEWSKIILANYRKENKRRGIYLSPEFDLKITCEQIYNLYKGAS